MSMLKRIHRMFAMMLFMCPGIMRLGGEGSSNLPRFTYTGTYSLIDDENRNWRIRFLTSGTLQFRSAMTMDVFLVGGGAGGGNGRMGGGKFLEASRFVRHGLHA